MIYMKFPIRTGPWLPTAQNLSLWFKWDAYRLNDDNDYDDDGLENSKAD